MRKTMVLFFVLGPLTACAPRQSVRRDSPVTATETDREASRYTGPKRRIGVVDFEHKTSYGQRAGQDRALRRGGARQARPAA